MGYLQCKISINSVATTEKATSARYAEILNSMTIEENRRILRPRRALYRELSCQILEIMPGSGLSAFLSEYFAKLLEKQATLICSQILEEVAVRRTAVESISLSMNKFFEAFVDACFHIHRIMASQLNVKEISDILVEVVKGNQDERDHLRSLIESSIADFLIDTLRILNGKIINKIMVHALTSATSINIDALLQNSIELNSDSPARPIIESWIKLKDLAFLLAHESKAVKNILKFKDLMKHKKFLIQAGCEGLMAPATDQHLLKIRRPYRPIHAVIQSFSESLLATDTLDSALKRKRDQQHFIDNYSIMQSAYTQKENVKGRDSRAKLTVQFYVQESESDSVDSNKNVSTKAPYHDIDPASAADVLTEKIRKADQEMTEKTPIDEEQTNLIDDSWMALIELQSKLIYTDFNVISLHFTNYCIPRSTAKTRFKIFCKSLNHMAQKKSH